MSSSQHVYEIRPRKDRRGFDLISDRLPLGLLWFEGPDAFAAAVSYAKFFSRSQPAIIRLFDQSGAVIETHEEAGDFKEWATFKPPTQPQLMPPLAPRKPPLSKPRAAENAAAAKLLEQKATQAQTKAEAIPAKASFAETDAEEAFRSKSMNIAENDA